jgi:ubiquinone/menaquinone biosynthesis C-methylase UbiE
MTDPFENVSAAGPEMIGIIVDVLEARVHDPQMIAIIDTYLAKLEWPDGGMVLEIGAGTGGISRRIAELHPSLQVLGVEPSPELVAEAQRRAEGLGNLRFQVGDGAALAHSDASADVVVLHTVLSHVPQPEALLLEAFRVLRPGGQLVLCDADFSKISIGTATGDPLEACAVCVREYYVTHAWLAGSLRRLAVAAGFKVTDFEVTSRLDLGGGSALGWIRMATAHLTSQGIIGPDLAKALEQEYKRRWDAGTLYGFLPFATLIAKRPEA